MFGYVVADLSAMTQEQQQRYQGCYCGLCRTIGMQFGSLQRMALNYDMTFLVLLLSSLYEPEEQTGSNRCMVYPVRPRVHWSTDATEYAAAMNMALAYHNCMDNWHDDRSLTGLAEARLFRTGAEKAAGLYPRQWSAIEQCLKALSRIEAENDLSPDSGANAFGELMGEIFVWKQDRWEPQLRQMGQALGRFIYLMDAVMDLPSDLKKDSYNPLKSICQNRTPEDFRPILSLHLGECTEAFEQLPLVQDTALLRNILYSGVWAKFNLQIRKSARRQKHV